jgi:hypothetical protein
MNDDVTTTVYMKIYKGKHFSRKKQINDMYYKKVVAFDLDETLGSFFDLEILWRKVKLFEPKIEFNTLLDMYPEFLRYGILSILDFLYKMKNCGECEHVYIYTNNQCSPEWVKLITKYFDYKLDCKKELFDKIIYAFKINNRRVNFSRTTHSKTYNDFLKCTLLPKSTEICFVDNSYFSEMNKERVYYVKPTSYHHNLSTRTIVERFSEIFPWLFIYSRREHVQTLLKEHFLQNGRYCESHVHRYYVSPEINQLVANKLMYHIQDFFYSSYSKRRTRKMKVKLSRFTRKKGKNKMENTK